MRKCGRSIISPEQDQYKHYCNDLHEYDEEINLAIEHIIQQAKTTNRKILLFGHSTGGLIATLYTRSGSRRTDIDGLILNSPYFSPAKTTFLESILLKLLIKCRRSQDIDAGWYGRSIHLSDRGEWNFDLKIKPIEQIRLHGAFFTAVNTIQEELIKQPILIQCPILFMCSNRSIKPGKTWRDEYAEGKEKHHFHPNLQYIYLVDLVLDVKTMQHIAATIGTQVTIHEIENAKHDIFLSKEFVREKAFHLMFYWLEHLEEEDWKI
jgi:alpha-beta hydrolase superfamily lysophospholipase